VEKKREEEHFYYLVVGHYIEMCWKNDWFWETKDVAEYGRKEDLIGKESEL
jgi:hypothetical protein